MPTAALLRRDLSTLVDLADRDLNALWGQLDSAAEAGDALNDVLPALIATYGSAAATISAEWYDDLRAERAVAGRFAAIPAEIGDPGVPALVGWAAETADGFDTFQSLILGGLQRRIFNHSRQTVAGSAIADRAAQGWRRVGVGGCGFCSMLLGRGAVYTEASVDFEAHDHCRCGAEPAF
jgi:hypothetical protein